MPTLPPCSTMKSSIHVYARSIKKPSPKDAKKNKRPIVRVLLSYLSRKVIDLLTPRVD